MRRIADVKVAFLDLIVLIIPFLIVAVLRKISSPSELVKTATYINITKFRTMKSSAPQYSSTGDLKDAHNYISKLGRFLRDTSIDKLPQLFNVLKVLGHKDIREEQKNDDNQEILLKK